MTTDIPATGDALTTEADEPLTTEAGEPLTTEAGEALTVAVGVATSDPAVGAATPGPAAAEPACALCRRLLAALDRAAAWLKAMA